LPEVVVDHIQDEALPVAKEWLTRQPSRADVCGELTKVTKAVEAARSAIERLLSSTDAAPARLTARSLIPGGGRRFRMGGMRLEAATKALGDALAILEVAERCIPEGPFRHPAASPGPVDQIHKAIQRGFLMAGCEPLQKKLRPSASATSPFRRIVGICYEAIGAETSDPERALKAYLVAWRKLAKALEASEFGTERPKEI